MLGRTLKLEFFGVNQSLSWEVRRQGHHVFYTGNVNGTTWMVTDPTDLKCNIIYPGNNLGKCIGEKVPGDPTRIRVDAAAGTNVQFGNGLEVYQLPSSRYYGEYGYIDREAMEVLLF